MRNEYENLKNIKSPWRRLLASLALSGLAAVGLLYTRLRKSTPRSLISASILAQVLLILLTCLVPRSAQIYFYFVGTVCIAGAFILPVNFQPQRQPDPRYHWVTVNTDME